LRRKNLGIENRTELPVTEEETPATIPDGLAEAASPQEEEKTEAASSLIGDPRMHHVERAMVASYVQDGVAES
jgi:hypothetical protein